MPQPLALCCWSSSAALEAEGTAADKAMLCHPMLEKLSKNPKELSHLLDRWWHCRLHQTRADSKDQTVRRMRVAVNCDPL